MRRSVRVPLYDQIKTRLLEEIETGRTKPGDRMPSERQLTQTYGVSRMTARQALAELESAGYLRRVQGKGTFASLPRIDQPLLTLTSFTEDMLRRGLKPGSQLISADLVPAGAQVAMALDVPETEPVVRIERLRLAGDQPMALETSHIVAALCPGLLERDLSVQSLYGTLRDHYGHHLDKARQTLEAAAASSYQARVLSMREGAPVLLMERVSRNGEGRAIEFAQSVYRGDRYRFTTELNRDAAPEPTGLAGHQ